MTRKSLAMASALLLAAMALIAIAVGSTLPNDIRLPIHWNLSGEADNFAPKWPALFLAPAIAGGVSLFFYFLPALEPRREGLERSEGLYLWGWAALLIMCTAIDFVVVSLALRWHVPVNQVILGATGLMLVLIGNQLGKSRSMYLIGLRTPWTLASEEVWIKTHRLAGKLMVSSGLLMIGLALLPLPSGLYATALLGLIGLAAVVPILYSYVLWRRERRAA